MEESDGVSREVCRRREKMGVPGAGHVGSDVAERESSGLWALGFGHYDSITCQWKMHMSDRTTDRLHGL